MHKDARLITHVWFRCVWNVDFSQEETCNYCSISMRTPFTHINNQYKDLSSAVSPTASGCNGDINAGVCGFPDPHLSSSVRRTLASNCWTINAFEIVNWMWNCEAQHRRCHPALRTFSSAASAFNPNFICGQEQKQKRRTRRREGRQNIWCKCIFIEVRGFFVFLGATVNKPEPC